MDRLQTWCKIECMSMYKELKTYLVDGKLLIERRLMTLTNWLHRKETTNPVIVIINLLLSMHHDFIPF